MARIAGIDLPKNKALEYGLTAIYGIGLSNSRAICALLDFDPRMKVIDLTDDQISKIRRVLEEGYTIEGQLRTQISLNIKRLIEIQSYRGLRHRRGLPVRGQKTKTNARTRKGPAKTVPGKKK
jgi:small subunit ribosomal protein S13|tara:strand:- start:2503 stop:2871 length:369 start_codon:yes stop_codon:yes gene_type:complete